MLDKIVFICLVCLTLGQNKLGEYFVKRGQIGPAQPVYLSNNQPVSVDKDQSISAELELEEITEFAETVLRYFDFNSGGHSYLGNVLKALVSSRDGRSELGNILQWKGDLLQRLTLLALTALSLYTLSQILGLLSPLAAPFLGRTFSSFNSTLATALQALYDQVILVKDFKLDLINTIGDFFLPGSEGEDDTVAARRRRRAVDDLSNVVFSAIRKYQNREE